MPDHHGASRRTIIKGVAWSAPAVTMAAAAPTLAASGTLRYQSVPEQTFTLIEEPSTGGAGRSAIAAAGTAVTVSVSATNFPLEVPRGVELAPPGLTIKVTIPEALIATIRTAEGMDLATHLRIWDGTVHFDSADQPPVGCWGGRLFAPDTPIPDTGDMTLQTGDILGMTADRPFYPLEFSGSTPPGTYDLSLSQLGGLDLAGFDDDGNWTGQYPRFGRVWTLTQVPGPDNVFATVTVY